MRNHERFEIYTTPGYYWVLRIVRGEGTLVDRRKHHTWFTMCHIAA